ncbi:DUF2726 domain-containing protein [Vibrio sonorensis]|uniref:DUF2726 domain-containing protein n=1 Tax=Vibrio sonorensis TaxID=1004316 RepID=UPI0008DACDB3|nr:DUF2726 domain-containing protein [Vibrio sonorensis]
MFELFTLFCAFYVYIKLFGKHHKDEKNLPTKRKIQRQTRTNTRNKIVNSLQSPSPKSTPEVEHKKKSHLCTKNEQNLYATLLEILPSEYVVHCQVSLMALIQPKDFKNNSRTWAKRMDFVITDRESMVLAVIELDDSTHKWKSRQQRDKYVNESLEGHHTLIRIGSERRYDPCKIALLIEQSSSIRCERVYSHLLEVQ